MKLLNCALLVLGLSLTTSLANAGELKAGLKAGDAIGAFEVIRVSGPDDGVKDGDQLCYRCKYGDRPMVMVFARKPGKELAALAKHLDEAVGKNSEKKLAAFVGFLAKDADAAKAPAKEFGKGLKNVPVVLPVDGEKGPEDYALNADAQVTVILASQGKVVAAHAVEGLDEKTAKAILADVPKLLK